MIFHVKILQVIHQMHEHNHDSEAAVTEVLKVLTAIKQHAEETVEVWHNH